MMGQRDWFFQQETSKPTAVGDTLRRFWSYFRRYSHVLLGVGGLVLASTLLQVAIPALMGEAVDCFFSPAAESGAAASASAARCWYAQLPPQPTPTDYINGLGGLVLLIAAMYVASALITGLQFYLMLYAGQHVLRTLRVQVFAHIQRLSLRYFTQHEAGDVMSRITNDADTIH